MLTDFQPWLESLNVTIPRNYATNGNMFQLRVAELWLDKCLGFETKVELQLVQIPDIQPTKSAPPSPKEPIPICSIIP